MDIRYIYFLRRKGNDISVLMAVKVPYAYNREQRLHKMFASSNFTMTKRKKIAPNGLKSIFEAQCKIGIATNLPRRLGTIQADKLSGKTEWFTLGWWQRWAVRSWLAHWWLMWFFVRLFALAAICGVGYWLEKYFDLI